MNITELARQVKIPTSKLREILPGLGFDIGKRAIKVDDKIAREIAGQLNNPNIREHVLERNQKLETCQEGELKESGTATHTPGKTGRPERLQVGETIVVKELAQQMGIPVTKLILELMKNGVMAALNQRIDFETAAIIAEDLGYQVEKVEGQKVDLEKEKQERAKYFEDDPKNLVPRPPVVVVMGHVDHGKTKLLDAIRQTQVAESEAGGITQHIGAYQVEVRPDAPKSQATLSNPERPRKCGGVEGESKGSRGIPRPSTSLGARDDRASKRMITFIDTPGHEAFSAMRSRGAQVADMAILVVAADDSVQPQTIEAISHIKAAGLPFIVAINKIDKPEANLDKTKTALAEIGLTPEDWGGQTVCVEISAKQKINIDKLLDTLLLVYEMEKEEIQGNPQRRAVGTIIESRLDKGEGPVATVLVQTGTLKKGDLVKIGNVLGKVRLMKDWQGYQVEQAPPSMPVRIIGLKSVPEVGEILHVESDVRSIKKELREKKEIKAFFARDRSTFGRKSFKTSYKNGGEEEKKITMKKLNIILKCDVLGSQEAILESLDNLQQPDLIINVIRLGLGNITEVDVERAENQKALLIGFNVRPTLTAENMAHEKNVAIKTFKIIYELLDYLKGELNKMLESTIKTTVIGKIKVLKIFRTEKNSQIAGGKVLEGKIVKDVKLNIYRNNESIGQAKLSELQSAKQVVTEVLAEQEAGLKIEGFNEVREGDIIEVVKEEKITRSI